VTGDVVPVAFSEAGSITRVALTLPPCGSLFVIFRKTGKSGSNASTADQPLKVLSGPWQVAFDPKWGGPESATFATLQDWTTRPEEGIRHYSGAAVYRSAFEADTALMRAGRRVYLDLGAVQALAEVTLNGQALGALWTQPWRVEMTKALRPGTNEVEIRVTNLWPNRLIGDAALPQSKRFTETNINPYKPEDPLLTSGLLGPVTLLARP